MTTANSAQSPLVELELECSNPFAQHDEHFVDSLTDQHDEHFVDNLQNDDDDDDDDDNIAQLDENFNELFFQQDDLFDECLAAFPMYWPTKLAKKSGKPAVKKMSKNTQITQLSIAYVSVATSLSKAFIKIAEVGIFPRNFSTFSGNFRMEMVEPLTPIVTSDYSLISVFLVHKRKFGLASCVRAFMTLWRKVVTSAGTIKRKLLRVYV